MTPSNHTTSQQRRYNIAATSRRCSDVVTTLLLRCVFAGMCVKFCWISSSHCWASDLPGLHFLPRPVDTESIATQHSVERMHGVDSTLKRRWFNAVCQLGRYFSDCTNAQPVWSGTLLIASLRFTYSVGSGVT